MKSIETKSAPAAIGPYSQAILANGFLYTSGQIHFFIWALRQLRCRRALRTSAIASYFASQSTPAAVLQSLTL